MADIRIPNVDPKVASRFRSAAEARGISQAELLTRLLNLQTVLTDGEYGYLLEQAQLEPVTV